MIGQHPTRFALPLIAAALWAAGAARLPAQHQAVTGFERLQAEVGAANLASGAGLSVTQVEALITSGGTDFAPQTTNTQFAGKSFEIFPSTGTASGHATAVGQRFYGTTSSFTPGVGSIRTHEVNNWLTSGAMQTGNSLLLPLSHGSSAINHSWIGAFESSATAENLYLRLDHLANADGLLVAAGMNNGNSTTLPQLLGQGYNLISVGRSDGAHSAGFTTVAGSGRIKPDLVAPSDLTSYATPMVASGALFLRATALADPTLSAAANPRAVKALLLATASKYKFPDWAQTTSRPLDLRFGAGEINLYNAHRVLAAGPREPSGSTTHPARGWMLATSGAANTSQTVFFEIPSGNVASRFAAALVWHRNVVVTQASGGNPNNRPYTFTPSLPNLTLRLHSASSFTVGSLVAESASAVDNLEHLHLPALAPGRYALVVHTDTADTPYSLAWFSAPTASVTTTAAPQIVRDGASFTLRFSRAGGDLSLPLRLPLTVTGSAVSGTHYTPAIPSAVVIPAGQTFVDLNLATISTANALAPAGTLNIRLAADFASAPLSSAQELEFSLHARPYDAWRFARFTSAQLADAAVSGDAADPDGDGLANLLEYAFVGEPLTPGSVPAERLPAVGLAEDGRLTLTYFHATDRPDLAHAVEWTDDLAAGPGGWQTGPAFVAEVSRTPVAGGELVTVRAESAPAAAPRQFLRLRVTRE
jgi:hypothetical protein